ISLTGNQTSRASIMRASLRPATRRSAAASASEEQPPITSLDDLAEAENTCQRCPLYRDATQAVPGEGRRRAPLMLVGEQPGDQEDRAGRPFVGPAGRMLDDALADAGITRRD